MRNPVRCLAACLIAVAGLSVFGQTAAHADITTACGLNAPVYYTLAHKVVTSVDKIGVETVCSLGNSGVKVDPADFGNAWYSCDPNRGNGNPGWELAVLEVRPDVSYVHVMGFLNRTTCAADPNPNFYFTERTGKVHYTMQVMYNNSAFAPYRTSYGDMQTELGGAGGAAVTLGADTTSWSNYICGPNKSRSNGGTVDGLTQVQQGDGTWLMTQSAAVCGGAKAFDTPQVAGEVEAVCVDINTAYDGSGTWVVLDCDKVQTATIYSPLHINPSYGEPIYDGTWRGGSPFLLADTVVGGVHYPQYKTRMRIVYRAESNGSVTATCTVGTC